jgi:wyosine [tRNA(Phe)-imidazoG37] synthetase (radical SAM superfamily)
VPFDRYVEGLAKFREAFEGKLWVEVMLMDGVNDSRRELLDIAGILERVEADEVHLSTPTRPPAEAWVKPPDEEGLERARMILGCADRLLQWPDLKLEPGPIGEISDAVLNIVSRHPMQEGEILHALGRCAPEQVFEILGALSSAGKIQVVERNGKRYWSGAKIRYPDLN